MNSCLDSSWSPRTSGRRYSAARIRVWFGWWRHTRNLSRPVGDVLVGVACSCLGLHRGVSSRRSSSSGSSGSRDWLRPRWRSSGRGGDARFGSFHCLLYGVRCGSSRPHAGRWLTMCWRHRTADFTSSTTGAARNSSEASFGDSAFSWYEGVSVRNDNRSLSTSWAVPFDGDVMGKLALSSDAIVFGIIADAIALASYAGESS